MLNSTHTILCFERTYRSHALSVHALPWCLYVQLNLMCMCDRNFIKFQMIDTIVVHWTPKCLLSINFIVEFTTFGSKLKKAYSTIYFYVLQTMHKIRMFAWLRLIVKNSYMKKKMWCFVVQVASTNFIVIAVVILMLNEKKNSRIQTKGKRNDQAITIVTHSIFLHSSLSLLIN